MAIPSNILKAVQTYQMSGLAYLENLCCFASNANAKFKDFQNKTGNLGSKVDIEVPPDAYSSNGLVATFQASTQLYQTLVCDQAKNAARAFTNQDEVFNLDANDYMDKFGRADVEEVANALEANLALNAHSAVPVMTVDSNGQSVPTGQLHTESGPYRFFGDGVTAINSYQQLAQMVTNFKNMGAVNDLKVFLPDTVVPSIIGNGLNQFVPRRNDETAMSWELGDFGTPAVKYLMSNLLPMHVAGTIGNSSGASQQMTVVSTNDPTGANITQITFSTPVNDSSAILSGDLMQFLDNIAGQQNIRYLTYRGHSISSQTVQIRATANASSSGGSITVNISPALVSVPGPSQNISTPITAGMKVQVLPSHKCGLLVAGNAFYLGMPKLPDEDPFPTASKNDANTGIALRMYYGSKFGGNQRGMVTDAIWGSTVVPKYSMRIAFPINV